MAGRLRDRIWERWRQWGRGVGGYGRRLGVPGWGLGWSREGQAKSRGDWAGLGAEPEDASGNGGLWAEWRCQGGARDGAGVLGCDWGGACGNRAGLWGITSCVWARGSLGSEVSGRGSSPHSEQHRKPSRPRAARPAPFAPPPYSGPSPAGCRPCAGVCGSSWERKCRALVKPWKGCPPATTAAPDIA